MYYNNYRIPSLDGLRAISIIIVILRHLLSQHYLNQNLRYIPILFDGQFGVNVFFVISGFLITTLLIKEQEDKRKVSIKKFYLRRIIRIFPAYFFLMFIYSVLQYVKIIEISYGSWITALTFTKFLNGGTDWYTWHTWSLSVEEWFYLVWPVLFSYLNKNKIKILLLIIVLIPFIRFLSTANLISTISNLSLLTRADAIAIGCLFAIYKVDIEKMILNENRYLMFFVLLIGLLMIITLSPYVVGTTLRPLNVAIGGSHGTIMNFIICTILIYSIQPKKEWWYNLLNNKIMIYIGKISFSLYLWQQLFIHNTTSWYNNFPVNLLFVVIFSILSYHLIEKQFLKLKIFI